MMNRKRILRPWLALALLLGALAAPTAAEPVKVLIDADPGIDDSMAILLAFLSPEIEVVGISTVFGNATIDNATANALTLVEMVGAEVPVARGAGRPLVQPGREPASFVHGEDGMGEVGLQRRVGAPIELTGAQFIVDMARRHPGEITLVPVGPLTNVALALKIEPRLPELIEEVVLMGGAARVEGNVSPVAEANIWNDPHAADIVFNAGWKLAMAGLDVTTAVRMTDDRLRRIAEANPEIGGVVWEMTRFYKRFYESRGVTGGFHVHDPSAVAYVIDRTLYETEKARVRVAPDGFSAGHTIAAFGTPPDFWTAWSTAPEVDVCVGVDAERMLDLYESTLSGGGAAPR
jgi:inosine-uridine nucleoside N-ribohydrolase